MSVKIQFLGGNNTVTGSKHLLHVGSERVLVDCGLFQGLKALRQRNWNALPFKAHEIDAVIISHAHIDHSGYLPLLVKQGFKGPIYTSDGTKALCGLLLPDSGHLQEEDAAFANKHKFSKHRPALPLYTEEDARYCLKQIKAVPWRSPLKISQNIQFELHRAGHILGASLVVVQAGGKRFTFSGDLGRQDDPTMPPPEALKSTDYLVVESTYGGRRHPDEKPLEILESLIHKVAKQKGRLLVPAFAVGRSQQLLYLIWKLKQAGRIPDLPVYLNSPMAIKATNIFCTYLNDQSLSLAECEGIEAMTHLVSTAEESKRLNEQEHPAIIISASGMATGGRVLHHLKKLAPDPKNIILFAGFQAAGTRGEAMLHGVDEIKIHGQYVPIRAQVIGLQSLSAHADCDDIMYWLKQFKQAPRRTFITHGEPLGSEALRRSIQKELHWECEVPDYQEIFKC